MQQMWEGRDYYLYFTPHTEYIRLEKWTNLPKVWLVSSIHTEIWDLNNWTNKSELSGFFHKSMMNFKSSARLPPLPTTSKKKKSCHTVCTYRIQTLNINRVEDCVSGCMRMLRRLGTAPSSCSSQMIKRASPGTWDFSLWTSLLSFKLWCLLASPSPWEV